MNSPTTANAQSTRRAGTALARLVAAVCAALALIALGTPSASAASRYTYWGGSPGALTQTSVVTGWPTYAGSTPQVTIQPASVRRSPATTGTQTVSYEYRLYTSNGGQWLQSWTIARTGTIPAGQQTATLPGGGRYGELTFSLAGFKGYVALELAVAFYSGNQMLGRFNLMHDQPNDYRCYRGTTLYGNCTIYSGGYLYLS